MTIGQILFAIITGLAVNECCDVSPWLAHKLARWSARRRYAPPSRAELRAEELAALINDRPGRLFKLITALGFATKAVVTRKVGPGVAKLTPLWQPTTLTVPVCDKDFETAIGDVAGHPQVEAVHQAWSRLTAEVSNAAKETGVGSRSWRRSLKKLIRVTGDDRWTLVSRNLDCLKQINLRTKRMRTIYVSYGGQSFPINSHWSFPTDSTILHYQTAAETAQTEIRRLTCDFLRSSAPR